VPGAIVHADQNATEGGTSGGDRPRDAVDVLRRREILTRRARAHSDAARGRGEAVSGLARCDRVGPRYQPRDAVGAIGRRGGRVAATGIDRHAGETRTAGGDGARDTVGHHTTREVLARGAGADGHAQRARAEAVLGSARRHRVGPGREARDRVGAVGGRGSRMPAAHINRDPGEPGAPGRNGPGDAVGHHTTREVLARGARADSHTAVGRAEGILGLARCHRVGAGGKA